MIKEKFLYKELDSHPTESLLTSEQQAIKVWTIFDEIASIPRKSSNECHIGAYLEEYAKKRQWACKKDDTGNILIEISPSAGFEHVSGIVLQGHQDMVCIGSPNPAEHGIVPVLSADGQWVQSRNRQTTLGADNGVGLATMLAIADEDMLHGPLALLFTVNEEGGMSSGVGKIKRDILAQDKYRYLLNLDSERTGEITVKSACGGSSTITLDVKREAPDEGMTFFKIEVKGLLGGHSGIDIGTNRANAIKLLQKLLGGIPTEANLHLVSFEGGEGGSVIPSQSEAVIAINRTYSNLLEELLNDEKKLAQDSYADGERIEIELSPAAATDYVMDQLSTNKLIQLLGELPQGLAHEDKDISDKWGVVRSTNLGKIRIINEDENHQVEIKVMVRSAEESGREEYLSEIADIADKYGARVESSRGYKGWQTKEDEEIVQLIEVAYRRTTGRKMVRKYVHGGLELSFLSEIFPWLQMVSIGPTIENPHSVNERAEFNSAGVLFGTIRDFIILSSGQSKLDSLLL